MHQSWLSPYVQAEAGLFPSETVEASSSASSGTVTAIYADANAIGSCSATSLSGYAYVDGVDGSGNSLQAFVQSGDTTDYPSDMFLVQCSDIGSGGQASDHVNLDWGAGYTGDTHAQAHSTDSESSAVGQASYESPPGGDGTAPDENEYVAGANSASASNGGAWSSSSSFNLDGDVNYESSLCGSGSGGASVGNFMVNRSDTYAYPTFSYSNARGSGSTTLASSHASLSANVTAAGDSVASGSAGARDIASASFTGTSGYSGCGGLTGTPNSAGPGVVSIGGAVTTTSARSVVPSGSVSGTATGSTSAGDYAAISLTGNMTNVDSASESAIVHSGNSPLSTAPSSVDGNSALSLTSDSSAPGSIAQSASGAYFGESGVGSADMNFDYASGQGATATIGATFVGPYLDVDSAAQKSVLNVSAVGQSASQSNTTTSGNFEGYVNPHGSSLTTNVSAGFSSPSGSLTSGQGATFSNTAISNYANPSLAPQSASSATLSNPLSSLGGNSVFSDLSIDDGSGSGVPTGFVLSTSNGTDGEWLSHDASISIPGFDSVSGHTEGMTSVPSVAGSNWHEETSFGLIGTPSFAEGAEVDAAAQAATGTATSVAAGSVNSPDYTGTGEPQVKGLSMTLSGLWGSGTSAAAHILIVLSLDTTSSGVPDTTVFTGGATWQMTSSGPQLSVDSGSGWTSSDFSISGNTVTLGAHNFVTVPSGDALYISLTYSANVNASTSALGASVVYG